ncbi:protease inhibitor I42 family protein [Mucilaginibacter sp. X5P1]|uniref:protease inhibitor I42 family protein n=1 Tax=Mucilaginibacter sp. X5P1 TaxID=2723088 RepID=UPI001617A244|nr:protease inhibitor I42 family protein [Mucilaginibacter sp. X5P1]MBB6139726.1 putative secreted protein [Mucilaginibacter sp. X5P1]
MKNLYKTALFLFAITTIALASCKKDNNAQQPALRLSVADTGKTLSVAKGQTIAITISNPGDGGFTYNAWQYDATVLHLDSHVYTATANPTLIGDFGKDTWQFSSLQNGTSILKLTATQGYTITMFNDHIVVK